MKKLIADTNIFITALSAMAKRQQILPHEAIQAYELIQKIPVKQQDVNVLQALKIATEQKIYAYDGYFLQLALETELPILTLDKGMRHVAKQLQIPLITDEK